MAQMIHNHGEPSCPVCGMVMVLVRIDPRVASLSELRTFRCFACDDVRTARQQTILRTRVSAIARPVPVLTRAA